MPSKMKQQFQWKKLGKLFDPKEYIGDTWMHEFAQSPSSLIMEDRIRVYFCSRPPKNKDGMYVSYLSYIDLDKKNLNNIINICSHYPLELGKKGTFDEFGTNPVSVIQHDNEVRVYYAGWTRCESVPINGAIGVAISKDNGETFHRLGDGPVISYSPDEPFMMGSPRVRRFNNMWQLWYVSGERWLEVNNKPEPIYKIRMATSTDGINWKKHGKNLLENYLENECQACPDVFFRDNKYHMFYSYRDIQNYKTGNGGYRIGYAVSDDMFNWSRQDEAAGIFTSYNGWDSKMVNYPHIFSLDEDIYMLYQGNEIGRTGIGLAKLIHPKNWK